MLRLCGIPGSGKTVLASTLIEHLLHVCQNDSTTYIAYFFFHFNDSIKQKSSSMIRSLIQQLSSHDTERYVELKKLHSSNDEGGLQPSASDLLQALHRISRKFKDLYFVLDAVDECQETRDRLHNIKDMMEWDDVQLHMIITYRLSARFESSFGLESPGAARIIRIDKDNKNDDINLYISHMLQNRLFQRWESQSDIRELIKKRIAI